MTDVGELAAAAGIILEGCRAAAPGLDFSCCRDRQKLLKMVQPLLQRGMAALAGIDSSKSGNR